MARHLHHHHHHAGFPANIPEIPILVESHPAQLKHIIDSQTSQSRSLFVRTPPGVGGGSSSSDSSESDSGGFDSESSGSSDSTDKSDDSGFDSDNSSSNEHKTAKGGVPISIPVALGVIIPILLAVIIFVFLHRRHVRRLRQEDANDPHKSLDFGWDPSANPGKKRGKNKKGKPDVAITELNFEKGSRRDRGLSMDMTVTSPYLLPPALQGSRESLHSMSRTIHSQDDRYRPATTYVPGDSASLHSHKTRPGMDDSSSQAGSNSMRGTGRDEMKQDLLGNAQRMSRSPPATANSPIPQIQLPESAHDVARKPVTPNPTQPSNNALAPGSSTFDSRDSYQPNDALRKSNNYLGALIHSREPSADVKSPETERSEYLTPRESPAIPSTKDQADIQRSPPHSVIASPEPTRPPRQQSLRSSQHASIEHNYYDDSSEYGDAVKVTPASPRMSDQDYLSNNRGSSQEYMPPIEEYSLGVNESDFGYEVRRLSMGTRPLPPEDPHDNPEQRANRIRSFYKEYFDSNAAPQGADYYEDYDENYLGDGAIFDPSTGDFVTSSRPYAEPYGRRAMTPPPRIGGRRHAATMSGGSRYGPGSRAYSLASGGRPPPRKKLPPPQALRVLPTPHMIKEDAFALPIDFAPPTGAKERRAGVPESPRGGMRPYSPALRSFTPLARSTDDLACMPSPHLLRKSGTFTALDFAPPPRFKNDDTASDAGSIRSNRSGMSARTQHAVRTGAYRVSRIPKEVVGTKNELMDSLKPQWNLNNNTGTIGMPVK